MYIGLSLSTFVALPTSHSSSNRQMKQLSGCPLFTSDWLNSSVCRACLLQAKHNVANVFAFVGLAEDLAFFVVKLRQVLGGQFELPPLSQQMHPGHQKAIANRSRGTTASPELLSLVKQHHLYDEELYQYTLELLCRRYLDLSLCTTT